MTSGPKTKVVLVIDNDEEHRKSVRALLESRNIETWEALDAENGEALVRKQRPDLILIDLRLYQISRPLDQSNVRSDPRWTGIPLVALISPTQSREERKVLEIGFEGYIVKPVEPRSFLKTVSRYLYEDRGGLRGQTDGFPVRRRILLADDQESVKSITDILTLHGYAVVPASPGKSLVDLAAKEAPDLILLGLGSQSGAAIETTRALKKDEQSGAVPIILLTDLDDQENRVAGLEAGAEEFLTKPVRAVELLSRIRATLDLAEYKKRHTGGPGGTARVSPRVPAASPAAGADSPVVLLAESNRVDAKAVQSIFKDMPVRLETVASGEAARNFLLSRRTDLVVLDLLLPDMDGYEACRRLREMAEDKDIPVVVATYMDDLETRIRCLDMGVDDFFVKPLNDREFRARIKSLLGKKGRRDELGRRYEAAMASAIVDWLTGLYSSGFFKASLGLEIRRAERHNYPFSLILIDVDDFQNYNLLFGRPGGDIILQEAAHLIRNGIREIDLAVRSGDDEFSIILPYCDKAGAFQVAQRIRQVVNTHRFFHEAFSDAGAVSISAGIAMFPTDATTLDELIQKAGQMLFQAKRKGKNQICL